MISSDHTLPTTTASRPYRCPTTVGTMPYIPLLSSTLPPATPGPYKTVGYAVVRAPARAWCLPSPVFRAPSKRAGEPALRVCASTWAAYYPAERPSTSEASRLAGRDGSPNGSVPSSDETVQWMPEPVEGILSGYNRYFGSSASWLCTSSAASN